MSRKRVSKGDRIIRILHRMHRQQLLKDASQHDLAQRAKIRFEQPEKHGEMATEVAKNVVEFRRVVDMMRKV